MSEPHSLLTRTLKTGDRGLDVYGVKRTVYRYLGKDLHELTHAKPSVQQYFGKESFEKVVLEARKKAGMLPIATVNEKLWDIMGRAGAPDANALEQMQKYIDAHPKLSIIYPLPQGSFGGVCQGLHQTAGLAGNWAIDFCCLPRTAVLAVESGIVTKLSGHSPFADTFDSQGVFGWTVHFRTKEGYRYFVTHLGARSVTLNETVAAGDMLGTVGDQRFRPDHCHYGVTSPKGDADAKARITAVSKAPRID